MDEVVFEYQLTGAGFFDALFRVGDAELDLRQLGDSPHPLDELMTAALALARHEPVPDLLWDPEDGTSYRWNLSRNGDRLRIRVARVPDTLSLTASGLYGESCTELDVECVVRTFCSVVLERATEVIARYGPERYAALALGSFPFDLLEALREAVGLPPGQDVSAT